MNDFDVVVVGGGAAGFFAAITCAEANPALSVAILEKGSHFLTKVRISGGGRCNVTHSCFDPRQLITYYPRGGPALLSPFLRFQPQDTIAWFEQRGVKLKTEADGRIFPITDSSATIIDCLTGAANTAGVNLLPNCELSGVVRTARGGFELSLPNGETFRCAKLMLATGGCRAAAAGKIAESLGHSIVPPVPSLFTFHVPVNWLQALSGIAVPKVKIGVRHTSFHEEGAMLLTHAGLSGPAALKLSARAARELHALDYKFSLSINWLPELSPEELAEQFEIRRVKQPAKLVTNAPIAPLATRLWEALVLASGVGSQTRWSELSRNHRHQLARHLQSCELSVIGKSLNKDEFVTCGGVKLSEVNFKTMESKPCPGLFFGGELLDIDGLTGGFNFQSAWTTGWIAGQSLAGG